MSRLPKVLSLGVVAIVVVGCATTPTGLPPVSPTSVPPTASPAPSPSPSPAIAVTCDPQPTSSAGVGPLDCQNAIAAALAALPSDHPAVVATAVFHFDCPPGGAPDCTTWQSGLVRVTYATTPPQAVTVLVATFDGAVVGDVWGSGAAVSGWWGRDGIAFGFPMAWYRLNGHIAGLGAPVGFLADPPLTITVPVGHLVDLHMTTLGVDGRPIYPLPWSTDPSIVDEAAVQDGATATYQALRPGTAVLMTIGNCAHAAKTPNGVVVAREACPLVAIRVGPTT